MGCYNMTCAITGAPILVDDEIVVSFFADHSDANVLPIWFEARYNDYGTFENPDTGSFGYRWFKSFINDEHEAPGYIRDAIYEIGSDNLRFKLLPSQFKHSRAIFVHKNVWLKIVGYMSNSCERYHYFNENKYSFDNLARNCRESIIAQLTQMMFTEIENPTVEQITTYRVSRIMMLMPVRDHHFSYAMIKHTLQWCRDENIDPYSVVDDLVIMNDHATKIHAFASRTGAPLRTLYAGQTVYTDEHEILAALKQGVFDQIESRYEE